MKLIIEGACGRGKSTLAKELALITAVPVYRPFRGFSEHITVADATKMQDELGLSINGWEEDIYIADFLANVNASVILDRSLPSALAYNEVSTRALLARQRRMVVDLWTERMHAARATLLILRGSEEVRAKRSPMRGGKWEDLGIEAAVREIKERTNWPFQILYANTDVVAADVLAATVARFLTLGRGNAGLLTLEQ